MDGRGTLSSGMRPFIAAIPFAVRAGGLVPMVPALSLRSQIPLKSRGLKWACAKAVVENRTTTTKAAIRYNERYRIVDLRELVDRVLPALPGHDFLAISKNDFHHNAGRC